MRKALLVITTIILASTIPAMAKSEISEKELFRQIVAKTVNVGKNGHIPYRTSSPDGFPWQSGSGLKKVLVLLIEFPDEIHGQNRSRIEDFFISDNMFSVRGYYNTVSEGKLTFDLGSNGIPEWLNLKKNYMDYVKENSYSYYDTCDAVAAAGLKKAKENGLDITEYDSDGNGVPDIALYFFAGDSRRVGGIMPGAFSSSDAKSTVIMVSEDLSSRSNNTPSLIHELAHGMIPLEDLYDYSYTSDPIQDWDIMDGSSEGRCGLSAFSRWKAGWIDLQWLDKPGTYEIDNVNGTGMNRAYGVQIPGSDREWLLIENRQKSGVDNIFAGCPGEGIVVYHIDDKRPYAHLFNTLIYKGYKTHGVVFLKLLQEGLFVTADSSPNSLPYAKIDRVTPNIGIGEVSKCGEKMTFKLSFDRPKLPVVGVPNQLFIGKVVKNTTKTFEIPFVNVGSGTLHVVMNTKNNWLTLDRKSFIGNEETIYGTIDATNLKKGKTDGAIMFNNLSSDTSGFIAVEFEVAPIHGDLDGNDRVDDKDLEQFMKLYGLKGEDPGFKPEADFNSDGIIDFTDLLMLAKNYKAAD